MNQITMMIFSILISTTILSSTMAYRSLPTEYDCSEYRNDVEIIHAFPFPIEVNPALKTCLTTSAEWTKTRGVTWIKIVNQECIPSLIYCFKYLSTLIIVNTSFCHFEGELPVDIQRLAPSLRDLEIFDTKIIRLPNEISRLKRLQKFRLANTSLKSLPNSIGGLTSLIFFFITNNPLTSLPKTMIHLGSLHQLTLTQNPNLRSIQSLNGHPSLRILDTRQSPIELLPQNLPRLLILTMSDNKLQHLNGIESLGKETSNGKNFDFHGNMLKVLTPRISDVRNLSQLKLARNQLSVLPTNIFDIPSLHELDISNNSFSSGDLTKYIAEFRQKNPKLRLKHV